MLESPGALRSRSSFREFILLTLVLNACGPDLAPRVGNAGGSQGSAYQPEGDGDDDPGATSYEQEEATSEQFDYFCDRLASKDPSRPPFWINCDPQQGTCFPDTEYRLSTDWIWTDHPELCHVSALPASGQQNPGMCGQVQANEEGVYFDCLTGDPGRVDLALTCDFVAEVCEVRGRLDVGG